MVDMFLHKTVVLILSRRWHAQHVKLCLHVHPRIEVRPLWQNTSYSSLKIRYHV